MPKSDSAAKALEFDAGITADSGFSRYNNTVFFPSHLVVDTKRTALKEKKFYLFCKRVIDLVGSLLGLVLLSPVFLIVAIAIKLDSEGPVFYSQTRIGRQCAPFTMYKFRSMCQGADQRLKSLQNLNEREGPAFKIANDPRVTRVGRVLRAMCIDELPQLVNVIKGDMSLVGPRPPLPNEVARYTSQHMKRLAVRPGLTCYWQISDRKMSFDEWVQSDLRYIKERCVGIDFQILLKTLLVVFGLRGAR